MIKYISAPRFSRYSESFEGDFSSALKLYISNAQLSAALHPLLTQFEVVFRNAIVQKLSEYFKDSEWILNKRKHFLKNTKNDYTINYLVKILDDTRKKLERKKVTITSDKVISELNFGFWELFYLPHNYGLVEGCPIKVFPSKPSDINRAKLKNRLTQIRLLRNRINHCEPICFKENEVNLKEAIYVKQSIFKLIEWINSDLTHFFETLDDTDDIIHEIEELSL